MPDTIPTRYVYLRITKNQHGEPVLPDPVTDVKVGEALSVIADDASNNYCLWLLPGNFGPPSEGFPIKGGTQVENLRRIDVDGGKQVNCPVISEGTILNGTVTFKLGVSINDEAGRRGPRGHGGGSGSAGTLNVSPT